MEVPPIGGQTDCTTLERSNSRSQRAMLSGGGGGGERRRNPTMDHVVTFPVHRIAAALELPKAPLADGGGIFKQEPRAAARPSRI